MRVTTVAEMRSLDARAIATLGIPELLLMEDAGHAALSVLERVAGPLAGRRVAVIAGVGNNGGDGLVAARLAHAAGASVRVCIVGDPTGYRAAAAVSFGAATRLGLLEPDLSRALATAEIVVDALFGTGLGREVTGDARVAVEAINSRRAGGALVLSLDIPSGVHGDTGGVLGVAVRAHHTVAFGLPKLGNLLYPGHELGGQLWVTPLSFPPELRESASAAELNDPPVLPRRSVAGHKGSYGEALFVAGSRAYAGAPVFASLAHLKAGGGYARLAVPASLAPTVAYRAPEVVLHAEAETAEGSLSAASLPRLRRIAAEADVTVVGPGLSLDREAGAITLDLVRTVDRPLVVDGDGLTHLAADPAAAAGRKAPLVLTPHPGELARLLGVAVDHVNVSRLSCLRETVSKYRAIVVSKGAHTLIGLPDGSVWINLTGNSGMATPGSGDVLTGVITAMHGLGLSLEEAVRASVFVHGVAGDIAARELGKDGITATDILGALPRAVRDLRENREELWLECYGKIRSVL